MASNVLTLDATLIEQSNNLVDLEEADRVQLFDWAFALLEGANIVDTVKQFSASKGISAGKIGRLCTALGSLLWECSRFITKDLSALPQILIQFGMNEKIVPLFVQVFRDSKQRIKALKGPLALDTLSYKDFHWRLDIELSKRALTQTTEPTFQIRLDLENDTVNHDDPQRTKVYHLQTDYANLKILQQELQKAIDENAGVHSQRISRYIS